MPDDPDLFPPCAPEPVGLPDLPPVQHAGERVLTTELLAKVYETDPNRLRENYDENRDRFREGVHFHKLKGEALRAFKNYPGNSDLVGAKAPHLILWTERGAARHAKMLHTDAAWTVFGKLEETYFSTRPVGAEVPSTSIPVLTGRAVVADFKAFASLGPILGYDVNQAVIAANRAVRHFRGVDVLAAMGATHLIAPDQEAVLTVTDIGEKIGGLSAQATNQLLVDHGFQIRQRDHKNRIYYEATDLGRLHSRMMDVDISKPGTSKQYLAWLTSVVEPLKAAIGKQEDAA